MPLPSPLRLLCLALVVSVTYVAGALVTSGPASAAGTLTVQVSGAGLVSNSELSCQGSANGSNSGTCAYDYPNVCDYSGPKPPCVPQYVDITATDVAGTGFTFDHWAGACSGTSRTCTVHVDSGYTATAVFVDSQAPTVLLTQPGAGPVRGTIALAANAADNLAVTKVEFLVRGVVVSTDTSAPYSSSFDTTTVPDGLALVVARSYDAAGNLSNESAAAATVDNTAPTLTVTGPNGQAFGPGSTQSWTLSAADATTGVAGVQCSVVATGQPAAFGPCTGGTTGESVSNRPEGSWTFTARVTDHAGNTHDEVRTFTIDATPPDTSISSGPAAGAPVAAHAVAFGIASEPGATFGCRVYRSGTTAPAFAPCTSPFSASGLDDGSYVFEARASDAAGNVDATPATRTFTVDTTAPTVSISKQPKRTVRTPKKKVKVTFGFAADDPAASFRCSLDGAAYSACSAGVTFTVKVGKHTLSVVAVDSAGNVSQAAAVSFKVKRVPKHR